MIDFSQPLTLVISSLLGIAAILTPLLARKGQRESGSIAQQQQNMSTMQAIVEEATKQAERATKERERAEEVARQAKIEAEKVAAFAKEEAAKVSINARTEAAEVAREAMKKAAEVARVANVQAEDRVRAVEKRATDMEKRMTIAIEQSEIRIVQFREVVLKLLLNPNDGAARQAAQELLNQK